MAIKRLVFGNDDALQDDLVLDCFVEPKVLSSKPILTGRWGAGKSAIFLNRYKELTNALEGKQDNEKPLWYIGEHDMDVEALVDLLRRCGSQEKLKRHAEHLWKAEIVRKLSILLLRLWNFYDQPKGEHWDKVKRFAAKESKLLPIWRRIPEIMEVILGNQDGRGTSIRYLCEAIERSRINSMLENVQACLRDVRENSVQPAIVIEPIETPASPMEERNEKVAQPLISGLLNLFCSNFIPAKGQLVELGISVPWHRYCPDDLDLPQRFSPYVFKIEWTTKELRKFINERIAWELRNLGRTFSKNADPWSMLFEAAVENDHCRPRVMEDSFMYVLRHTHYRARDVLRFTRTIVEKEAHKRAIGIDELLKSKEKIPGITIREAIREDGQDKFENEFKLEVRRKCGAAIAERYIDCIKGMSIPFTLSVDSTPKCNCQGCVRGEEYFEWSQEAKRLPRPVIESVGCILDFFPGNSRQLPSLGEVLTN